MIARIKTTTIELLMVLAAMFGLLYGVLFLIVRHADRILRRSHEDLRAAKASEEAKVIARTSELQRSNQALARQGGGRRRQSREIPVPRQHEPRAADAAQCHPRLLILDLSRIELGQLEIHDEQVDRAECVDECVRVLDGKTGHAGLEIETAGCRDLPVIRAANRKVRQVLFNVLANAIKFSPRGGIISIRGDRAGAGGAALRVSDTGIGMSAGDIDTAFSLFGQVASGMDRDYQGAGLGLALCKSIMEGHGGTLDIESELGVGTIVTLNFPHERGYGPRHGLGT